MQQVDSLSRHPAMIIRNDTLIVRFKNSQLKDEHICTLKSLTSDNNSQEYFVRHDILNIFVSGFELIVVLRDMQTELIKLAHEKGNFQLPRQRVSLNKCFLYVI